MYILVTLLINLAQGAQKVVMNLPSTSTSPHGVIPVSPKLNSSAPAPTAPITNPPDKLLSSTPTHPSSINLAQHH
ncbi:hypothetical protein QBC40DRAFT_271084 [Triangularia verruculosa]|uniref:Uncharacterized protein n=1 Tax=Triangularia verruculosa TaxID=2587418 RepID=A0AAN7B0N0_9PEZI|nr:hypothetical protein QBC40DRAFT_271084 [Triangularia verruculosa]